MILEELKDKRILILGFGREGKDSFLFLRKLFPKKIFGVADKKRSIDIKNKKGVKLHLGKDYLLAIKDYNVVVKSPGIPFKILPNGALKKIITQTDIFFENCKGIIIGVTGTKGKSTTSSMIFEILKKGGMKAFLIGNVEKPVLSFLKRGNEDAVFVYELSSHQLYNLKKSPQVAVFLNIYPEHLDYYRNFKEYARAKANITLFQKKEDYLVFNQEDKIIANFAKKSKAKKIPVKGEYYLLNKAAAKAVGGMFKISPRIIEKTINEFKGLPHRLELVGKFKGITFYNDALATVPEATIAALDKLGRDVKTIILGGLDRNIKFDKLAKKILEKNIETVILFPETGKKIWREIEKRKRTVKKMPKHFFSDSMKEAVKIAYLNTEEGKICLLSTASPSFNMFRDYKEKGDLFKKYVKEYIRAKKR